MAPGILRASMSMKPTARSATASALRAGVLHHWDARRRAGVDIHVDRVAPAHCDHAQIVQLRQIFGADDVHLGDEYVVAGQRFHQFFGHQHFAFTVAGVSHLAQAAQALQGGLVYIRADIDAWAEDRLSASLGSRLLFGDHLDELVGSRLIGAAAFLAQRQPVGIQTGINFRRFTGPVLAGNLSQRFGPAL